VRKFRDRDVSGYWLSQLIVPWIPASEIIKKSKKDASIFHNFCLGLPYISKDQSVSRGTITRCIFPTTNPLTGVVMGIDNGVMKTVVLGNVHGIFKIYETDSWEEVEADFVRYNATAVCDLNPYPNPPRKLAQKYSGRFFTNTFVQDSKDLQIIHWGKSDRRGTVTSDRTKIIDYVVSELNSKDVVFNMVESQLEEYITHWLSMYRIIKDTPQGIKKPTWETIEGKPDHFAHASVYWRIALEQTLGQGGVVRAPRPGRHQSNPTVSSDGTVPALNLKEVAKRTLKRRRMRLL